MTLPSAGNLSESLGPVSACSPRAGRLARRPARGARAARGAGGAARGETPARATSSGCVPRFPATRSSSGRRAVRPQPRLPLGRARRVREHAALDRRAAGVRRAADDLARSTLGDRFHRTVNAHHGTLAEAIEAGDEDAAGSLMTEHVEFLRPFYEKAWRRHARARLTPAARGRSRPRDRAVRRGPVGDAAARRPRRRRDQDRGPGGRAATSAATCRRSRRARDSLFFETFNRNKRSVSLDLRHQEGSGVFEDLVRVSDVVYSNLRGDQPAKLRLALRRPEARQPARRLLLALGFGMTGPRAGRAATTT